MKGASFASGAVRVQVPATSANLGPGFDTLGLALSRYDEVTARITVSGVDISVTGEGADRLARDERHLVLRSMRAAFDALGAQPSGLALECTNQIPHGRGLGSSAAAIVAGIELARGLVAGGRELLDDAATLALAGELEGHPDNVAACLLGGLTVAWTDNDASKAVRLDPVGVSPVLFIPTEASATEAARMALPATVPHGDAAFNASRSALLIVALTGRPDLLVTATQDRLHQSYRADAMAGSSALLARLRGAGLAAVISGAGSSVLALASAPAQIATARSMSPAGWEFAELAVADGALSTNL